MTVMFLLKNIQNKLRNNKIDTRLLKKGRFGLENLVCENCKRRVFALFPFNLKTLDFRRDFKIKMFLNKILHKIKLIRYIENALVAKFQ